MRDRQKVLQQTADQHCMRALNIEGRCPSEQMAQPSQRLRSCKKDGTALRKHRAMSRQPSTFQEPLQTLLLTSEGANASPGSQQTAAPKAQPQMSSRQEHPPAWPPWRPAGYPIEGTSGAAACPGLPTGLSPGVPLARRCEEGEEQSWRQQACCCPVPTAALELPAVRALQG